ncbi:glycosyltransferase [bacterium]|nr:glycosyltransferase [bacterium]
MISVITTSYNYSEYISQTIESVLAQTFSDWELIIVDDASTDNSVEIIKKYCSDSRIKLICHDKNKGLAKSIETALNVVQGEWIAFLESDDSLTSDALEKRLKTTAEIVFNSVNLIGEKDWITEVRKQVSKTEKELSKINFPTNILKKFDTKNPVLTLSSVMIKRELLTKEILSSPVDALLDWWMYINLAYKNDFDYIPEKLTNWRIHDNSYIKKPKRPHFKMVNVMAYYNVFKKNPSFELFSIVIICAAKMSFVRLKVYFIGVIRFIKSFLGLKKRKSPLFVD